MAVTYIHENDHDLALQIESTYGTDPGTVAGTEFFKHQSGPDAIKRSVARYDRAGDRDYSQGSVISTTKGRERSDISISADFVPNGATGTPTAPDIDKLLKLHFGTSSTLTAHTTTTSGSTGTSLVLTTGGGSASGIPTGGGCLIAVDVSSTYGIEVRRVVSRSSDTVTVDRAFSANPASGRNVYVGTTYKFSSSATLSATLKQFLGGTTVKKKVTGVIMPNLTLDCDGNSSEVVLKLTATGMGQQVQSLSDSRPAVTTNGVPLAGIVGKVWLGSTKFSTVKVNLTSNNGSDLRFNQFDSLYPTGAKRTGNAGRYQVAQTLDLFYTGGDQDAQTVYDNTASLTAQDVIVQLGSAVGAIVAWSTPKFIPDGNLSNTNGEVGLTLSGRCYGTSGDDEILLSVF